MSPYSAAARNRPMAGLPPICHALYFPMGAAAASLTCNNLTLCITPLRHSRIAPPTTACLPPACTSSACCGLYAAMAYHYYNFAAFAWAWTTCPIACLRAACCYCIAPFCAFRCLWTPGGANSPWHIISAPCACSMPLHPHTCARFLHHSARRHHGVFIRLAPLKYIASFCSFCHASAASISAPRGVPFRANYYGSMPTFSP